MTAQSRLSPQAAADLDDLVGWVLDGSTPASGAEAFLAAVRAAADRLAHRPQLGRTHPDLGDKSCRVLSLPRVRLLLVFNPTTTPPTILRVLHTSRDLRNVLKDVRT